MSYIPRPPAAAAAAGRPDEIRSVSSSHTSNSAAVAQLFARPLPSSSLVRIPSSTRVSIVKVFSDDSNVPAIPPIPDTTMNLGSASIASSSTTTPSVSTTARSVRTHRRTVSAGDEIKMAARASDTATPGTIQTVTTAATQTRTFNGLSDTSSGQKNDRPRLGLSSLRLAWSHARERHGRASDAAQSPQWTAEEVGALAAASVQYWRHGSTVDFSAVSSEMGRPAGEVRDMLEYMLQGYVRFGGGAFWAGERPDLIVAWAEREFPRSPVLNPAHALPGSALARSRSRLDTCLAVLRCRPHAAHPDTYAADRHGAVPSAQNVVGDFRESMRIHDVDTLSLAQRRLPVAGSATQHSSPGPANAAEGSSTSTSTSTRSPSRPATATFAQSDSAPGHENHLPASHASSKGQDEDQQPPATAPADSRLDSYNDTATHWDFRPGVANVPLFTGGLRNHQALNTLSRETRARKARRGSFRAEPSLTAVLEGRAPQNGTAEPSASFTFSVSPAKAAPAAAVMVDKGTSPAESPSTALARQRAHTVAHTGLTGQIAHPARSSRDSGNVDVSELRLPAASISDDMDPVAARLETSQPDSELDAHFGDIGPEIRLKVRRFVAQFVGDFPSDFQQRVRTLQAGKDGLCMTIDNFPDFEYNNDAFMKAIETIYRYVGGSVIYTCNMFFHVQLLHAIRIHHIPVTEGNWLRVNDFATRVFNKKIEDAQYVVLEEYTKNKSSGSQDSTNGSAAAKSKPSAISSSINGGRFDSIVGNEHMSPFDHAYYMDMLAHNYVQFFLQNNSDEIMKRARSSSYRPMPVALQVDEDKMPKFDVEIRNLLITFIWEDMPTSTLKSKEITLLRALELFNGEIADRCSFRLENMFHLMDKVKNEDGPSDQDRVIADISAVKEMPTGGLAQALGKSFARQYFDEDKSRFLEAMMHDHPFRPIERDELQEWMSRESSPFGDDIDYRLNTRLYKYLRRLRVRPSSKQWMQASGAATLSMIRRVKNAIIDKGYVEHIDAEAYAQRFKDIVRDARTSSDASTSSKPDVQNRPEDASKLRLSAFGKVPGWVSLLTESRSTDSDSSKDIKASSKITLRPAEQLQKQTSIHGMEVADAIVSEKQPIATNGTKSSRRHSLVDGNDGTQVAAGSPYPIDTIAAADPMTESAQQQQQQPRTNRTQSMGPADTNKDSVLVHAQPVNHSQHPHQLKGNMSMPGLMQQYTVPMPSGSYQHLSQPVSVAHMYPPYVPLDIHQHIPVMYPPIAPPYPIAQGNGQANMDLVMRKFEEMQEMFRQMQAEKRQGQA
ncbi:hypothetical protein EV178_004142 [Coemansia sp. RSA 1646]|nr:hypothetical protein EV178_004142 [Coemansia sp. RSA 1646]